MEIDCEAGGAVILSSDPQATAAFLQQTLQLESAAENGLQTGSFLLKVCPSNAALAPCCPDDMLLGLRHIALETDDIQNALHICKERGLRLQTSEEGGPRFNGKVYGTGLHYFNILTDFGLILEITEKHPGSGPRSEKWAQGLGHIGIQVSNLQCSIAFYARLGFRKDFEPVENPVENGTVRCCMMSQKGVTLELYEFRNGETAAPQPSAALSALILPWLTEPVQGPDGEWLLNQSPEKKKQTGR